jgi:hypothetical protein
MSRRFFSSRTVGIDTGQGFDQRGLAVVDVSGGACFDGKISKMSIEKLLIYAHRLNLDPEISLKFKPQRARAKRLKTA